jgi:molybdopterin-synthase adenylyltransferase
VSTPGRILVVGAGGLGCPASLALAQAGVQRITLIDPDTVELSNLHRQLWPRTADVGRPKVHCAVEGLRRAFPGLHAFGIQGRLSSDNARDLFAEHDVVVDGVDDWRVKLLLSDIAVQSGVPVIYGGVLRLGGQAMRVSREGVCLRCLFEAPESLPTCAQAGVLGSLAGAVGALQARMALETAGAGHGEKPGEGRLLVLDAKSLTARSVRVTRAKDCSHG